MTINDTEIVVCCYHDFFWHDSQWKIIQNINCFDRLLRTTTKTRTITTKYKENYGHDISFIPTFQWNTRSCYSKTRARYCNTREWLKKCWVCSAIRLFFFIEVSTYYNSDIQKTYNHWTKQVVDLSGKTVSLSWQTKTRNQS